MSLVSLLTLLFCGLLLSKEAHSGTSVSESFNIIQKGKHVFEVARNVVEATTQSDADKARKDLKSLQADKEHLVQHAQSTIKQLENAKSNSQTRLDNTEREIAKLEQEKQNLQQEKDGLKVTLEHRQRILRQNEDKVAEENRALERANDRLHDAKKDAQKKRETGAIVGGLLGLFTGGIGAGIVGGIAGTAGAEIINQIEGDIDRAKERLRDREHALDQAKRDVSETHSYINSLSSNISAIPGKMEEKRLESARRQKEASKIRNAIVFQKKSAEFWNMFLTYTENAGDQTSHLQDIVEMATKMQDWKILRSDGTRLIQASFLEAWEEVETAAKKSGSYYDMFLIE